MTDTRIAENGVDPMFPGRWSPRAFDGSPVSRAEMLAMLEAARWAPSAFNVQPWRFVYALAGSPAYPRFLDLLVPFNRAWAERAGALVFVFSDTLVDSRSGGDPKAFPSHAFDAGAAWMSLALQAARMGLHAHGMTGFDMDAARAAVEAPDRFRPQAAVAIGRLGDKALLAESLRPGEAPSGRLPLGAIGFENAFAG